MAYIGSKPANKPLTSSDITDSIVSLPKLAVGTDGNLITYDASGNPVAVATGNDGMVLTSAGAGQPPAFEAVAAGGKILQIQSLLGGNDFATTSGSFTDVSGMVLTITPSATNSKILLLCNTNFYQNTNQAYVAMRWERAISGGATTAFGHGTYGQSFARSAQAHDFWAGVGMTYLDSPNTTAEITYQVQASTTGAGTLGIGINSTNQNNVFALEIGA